MDPATEKIVIKSHNYKNTQSIYMKLFILWKYIVMIDKKKKKSVIIKQKKVILILKYLFKILNVV